MRTPGRYNSSGKPMARLGGAEGLDGAGAIDAAATAIQQLLGAATDGGAGRVSNGSEWSPPSEILLRGMTVARRAQWAKHLPRGRRRGSGACRYSRGAASRQLFGGAAVVASA
jgi:hypothetical protein